MHHLEPFAFVAKIEDPVVMRVGAAAWMLLHQTGEAFGESVAHFHHQGPQGGDTIQIRLLPGAQGDEFVNGQEFGFELSGLLMKRGAETVVEPRNAALEVGQHSRADGPYIGFLKAVLHPGSAYPATTNL